MCIVSRPFFECKKKTIFDFFLFSPVGLSAGREQPQQLGSHAAPERQTPRGVVQLPERAADIAQRPDDVGQSEQAEERVAPPVQSVI